MLGGEREVQSIGSYRAPTIGESFGASFSQSELQVSQLRDYFLPGLSSEQTRLETSNKLSAINEVLSDPRQGLGQKVFNQVGSMAGSILPTLPFALVGSAVGGAVAGVVGFGARTLALEAGNDALLAGYLSTQVPIARLATGALSHYLPRVSIGNVGTTIAAEYGAYKGFTIPEHFAEHYNALNNTLDVNHAIEDWGADNYGFLLGAIPMAAGYLAFKGVRGIAAHRNATLESKALDVELSRLLNEHEEVLKHNEIKAGEVTNKQARVSELQDHLQEAEDKGLITPAMHEWYLDYLENPNSPAKWYEGGIKILKDLDIQVDGASGRVWHEVITREGSKNFANSLYDQGITNFSNEERQLLSNYLIHNELDGYAGRLRDHPNLIDALKGLIHNTDEKIARHAYALHEFDRAIAAHLPKGVLKKHVFSQNNIYQHLKKIGVYSTRDIPYTIPRDVAYKLKLVKQIKLIEARKTPQYEKKYQRGLHKELKEKLKAIKLIHPADELMAIKEALLPNGKLVNGFENRRLYKRLEDLAQLSDSAQALLDRIHFAKVNKKQVALNNILKQFIEMVDSSASRIANPENVTNYLKYRVEAASPTAREFDELLRNPAQKEVKISDKELEHPSIIEAEGIETIKKSEFEFARESFKVAEDKRMQLESNTSALKDLLTCALGE